MINQYYTVGHTETIGMCARNVCNYITSSKKLFPRISEYSLTNPLEILEDICYTGDLAILLIQQLNQIGGIR